MRNLLIRSIRNISRFLRFNAQVIYMMKKIFIRKIKQLSEMYQKLTYFYLSAAA